MKSTHVRHCRSTYGKCCDIVFGTIIPEATSREFTTQDNGSTCLQSDSCRNDNYFDGWVKKKPHCWMIINLLPELWYKGRTQYTRSSALRPVTPEYIKPPTSGWKHLATWHVTFRCLLTVNTSMLAYSCLGHTGCTTNRLHEFLFFPCSYPIITSHGRYLV